MSTASDMRRHRELVAEYAERKRRHAARAAVAQKLNGLTHRLLRSEVANAKAAARLRKNAGTLAGDLDLFLNHHS